VSYIKRRVLWIGYWIYWTHHLQMLVTIQSISQSVCSPWWAAVASHGPGRVKIFHFFILFRPALGCTHPPIQWIQGDISPGGKAAGAWSWPITSAEVTKMWIFTSTSQYAFIIYCLINCLQFTKHTLSPLGLLFLHQSSGTGFQRCTFVPLPGFTDYPRATATAAHSTVTNSIFLAPLHTLKNSPFWSCPSTADFSCPISVTTRTD
jgi:hypothetical protein